MSLRSTASILLFLFALVAQRATAQQIADAGHPDSPLPAPFVPNIRPSLEVHRAPGPISIDGDLSDPGWAGAARAGNFTETYPSDMVRPPVETEAFITYDDRNLYMAFIAHDDPSTIRATLHDRDQEWNEDYCGILLDTYGNSSWAYEIFVNALGIQGDLLMPNNADEDARLDLVYQSRTTITADGYRVEIAVPFSSLRFPDQPSQTWRATFWRIHPRGSRQEYSWAAISKDNPCSLCQFGTLTGIENVHAGGSLDLLPSLTASKSGTRQDASSPMAYSPIESNVSLGARYCFTPSVTGEVTINPDFSQVESDAAQIDVNSTFALFYPEHRPFFQEGSDLFNSWIDAVYTRTINNPKVAAKLIARMGSTSAAYLGATDEQSPILIPDEEKSDLVQAGRSFSSIARVRQMFNEGSFIGGILTDRRFAGGGSGTLLSVDALYRISNNYQFEFQGAFTRTIEPMDTVSTATLGGSRFDRGRYTTALDGERYDGTGFFAAFQRHARDWSFDVDYDDRSPTFRALNGFETRNNRRTINAWGNYTLYPGISFLDNLVPRLTIGRHWNYDGIRKDEWLQPEVVLNFKAQTTLRAAYMFSNESFKGYEMDGINFMTVNINSDFSQPVSLGMDLDMGRFVARSLDVPVLGWGFDFDAYGTLRLFERLNIHPSFAYSRLLYPNSDQVIYDGFILRTAVNYQWTREIFLRLILQYDQFAQSFSIEPLVTYKVNPFTIFYAGSTHAIEDPDGVAPFNGILAGEQFFLKGQYLVQL